ncbi:receptor protein-tyrosine kinase CEPR1 [Abrus precatorius]|uniref:Receptor protein-tyrosine kinase CEPR1 n=1 Tax=Abrus precatorius TaxID=3816 RepID=A0A8B8LFE6_ABRPR|nr:receptor protein-tyrosine kinase CEPR1 [Abrus precatorius]
MNHPFITLLVIGLIVSIPSSTSSSSSTNYSNNQSQFFSLMKVSLSGKHPLNWDVEKPVCSFTGVTCNTEGDVINLDLSGWSSLSGKFPSDICTYLPELRVLRLGHNRFKFLTDTILNCSHLEVLDMNRMYQTGTLPDFSSLKSLKILDLSYNLFTGEFPMSVFNLTNLEVLNFNENGGFNLWQLPTDIDRLRNLKSMVLTTCMVHGQIPASIGNITTLVDLELSGNFLTGQIPKELGLLKKLEQLELYYNQHLVGNIPEELGNLTELTDLDMSVNKLSGSIPASVCRLPRLQVLQLYNNSLTGEIPGAIENSTTLKMLSLYDNFLRGQVPKKLGQHSGMIVLDLSENSLSGPLPTEVCKGGKLLYFLVLDNMFSGEIPESYANCMALLRFRVSNNRLEGSIPEGLLGLPHVSIIDLSNNNLTGPIPDINGNSKNLSELFLQRNRISGVITPTISLAINLVKIDFSYNLLSGPIPSEIGNLRRLNLLMLQGNKLSSSIPGSLSSLESLNLLDLSNNLLTGSIPESLSVLLPNSINFSHNLLSGPIPPKLIKGGLVESFSGNPGLCVLPVYANSSDQNFPICSSAYKSRRINTIWVAGVSVVLIFIGAALFLKRRCSNERSAVKHEDTLSSYFSYEVKSFHKITFDQREIIESLVDKNIMGHGGSGTVYKIELKSGDIVAVKRLWSRKSKDSALEDRLFVDKALKAEVETLGSIRHKNIVKLYCCFSSLDCSLLVYEYMPNGNLWDSLHEGWIILDWPTRYRIALGIAQGLAYLHHDLVLPIIHRDIKSTNILLDVDYQPKVADFGIAKVLQARGGKDSTTTVIAGTYGYLAPEHAYSSRATTKCDVYSFGVILMELLTGKKPVEAGFGENRNIVFWVSNKVEGKEGARPTEVFDSRLCCSFKDDMIKVLRIAIRCTYKAPSCRPTMKEVVQLLIEAEPRNSDSYKLSTKDISNLTVTKKPFES